MYHIIVDPGEGVSYNKDIASLAVLMDFIETCLNHGWTITVSEVKEEKK